jgi:hypothetical protein
MGPAFKMTKLSFQVEAYLPTLKQRPDLLIGKIAIEIQCSPLPIKRLVERTETYHRKKLLQAEVFFCFSFCFVPTTILFTMSKMGYFNGYEANKLLCVQCVINRSF